MTPESVEKSRICELIAYTVQPRVGRRASRRHEATRTAGELEEEVIQRRTDLAGVDDFITELALARRAVQRYLADDSLCGRLSLAKTPAASS